MFTDILIFIQKLWQEFCLVFVSFLMLLGTCVLAGDLMIFLKENSCLFTTIKNQVRFEKFYVVNYKKIVFEQYLAWNVELNIKNV